jgi:hypothetical protein
LKTVELQLDGYRTLMIISGTKKQFKVETPQRMLVRKSEKIGRLKMKNRWQKLSKNRIELFS